MPRVARIVVPGRVHHVVQRGNNGADVFFRDDDRAAYLKFLRENCERFGFGLLGYCLMDDHVHLVGTPASDESLSKAIGRTHFRYSQYVNRSHGRSGHLWQNRFSSCCLDDDQTWLTLGYIERNPVRRKAVRVAWRYAWSSAGAHAMGVDASEWLDMETWAATWGAETWKSELRNGDDEAVAAAIRLATSRGRPLGSDAFLSEIEDRLGRRVRALAVGRPRGRKPAGKTKTSRPTRGRRSETQVLQESVERTEESPQRVQKPVSDFLHFW
jgi:REP-associated tyrosine transposase